MPSHDRVTSKGDRFILTLRMEIHFQLPMRKSSRPAEKPEMSLAGFEPVTLPYELKKTGHFWHALTFRRGEQIQSKLAQNDGLDLT